MSCQACKGSSDPPNVCMYVVWSTWVLYDMREEKRGESGMVYIEEWGGNWTNHNEMVHTFGTLH